MQNCITLDIFADKSQKNEFLTPHKVWHLVFIYSTYSVKIPWPPVIYFRNYGRCFLGRCARFGIDVILAPVGLATWQLGYHSFIMKDAFNLKLLQQEDIDKTNKSWSFSFYSTWNHLGTYWPDTCHIWGSIYPETQHFRKFLWHDENSIS